MVENIIRPAYTAVKAIQLKSVQNTSDVHLPHGLLHCASTHQQLCECRLVVPHTLQGTQKPCWSHCFVPNSMLVILLTQALGTRGAGAAA